MLRPHTLARPLFLRTCRWTLALHVHTPTCSFVCFVRVGWTEHCVSGAGSVSSQRGQGGHSGVGMGEVEGRRSQVVGVILHYGDGGGAAAQVFGWNT